MCADKRANKGTLHVNFLLEKYILRQVHKLPKQVYHRVRSSTSCFKFQCLLVPLKPYSSCLLLFPRHFFPFIIPSRSCLKSICYSKIVQSISPCFTLLYAGCFFLSSLHVILCSQVQSRRSSPSLSNTTC
jgi:hypothetical protein